MIQVQINPRATTHAYISHYQDLNDNSLRYFYNFELLTSVELRRGENSNSLVLVYG